MKNYITKLLLVFFVGFTLLQSCSKDDSSSTVDINGGDAYRYQIMVISMPDNIPLNQEEYSATLGNSNIIVSKVDDHKLSFLVPNDVPLGITTLLIPSLNDTKVNYTILNPELTDTPENTIGQFQGNLNTFSQTLNTSPEAIVAQNNINNFNSIYTNSSAADKTETALFYKVNKTLIDAILLNDFAGKTAANCDVASLIVGITGGVVAIQVGLAGLAVPGLTQVLAAATLIAGIYTLSATIAYASNCSMIPNQASFNGIDAESNKSLLTTGAINLRDSSTSIVTLTLTKRSLNSGDSSSTIGLLASFFNSYTLLNTCITKTNQALTWINQHVLGANFTMLTPLNPIANTSSETSEPMKVSEFSNATFSVSNPNITIVSCNMTTDGTLNLKIKVTNPTATYPLNSFLYMTYNDTFGVMSVKVPITIEQSIIGTWTMISWEGHAPGVYVEDNPDQCGHIQSAHTLISDIISFDESDYNFSTLYRNKLYNIEYQPNPNDSNDHCFNPTDNPDTFGDIPNSGSGSPYSINGNTIIMTACSNCTPVPFSFISSNQLQLGDRVYIKN